MIYEAWQAHADALWPLRSVTRAAAPVLIDGAARRAGAARWPRRQIGAACEVFNLAEVTHRRPDWDIADCVVGGTPLPVREEVVLATPFATLRRFRKPMACAEPKVLLVAPMSGHFATLLRDTVRTMLPDHDVHVTDWASARDVPLSAGRFGLDEYIAHVMDFVVALGPGSHVVAICQPCVAALAATALLAEDDHPATPASLTLMAGPVDCRISPTEVNRLATTRPLEWFERHLISVVPWRLPGRGRRVYPGFVQLAAFMNMNRERHLKALRDYYHHVLDEDDEKARVTRSFYAEYFAVADLPAEFYLETVRDVFQDCALARGTLHVSGRRVRPDAIRRTALLTVEGERDDICAVGQTMAAHDLCSALPAGLRGHYVQPGVGHYGVFSGRRWQGQIYPLLRSMIHGM